MKLGPPFALIALIALAAAIGACLTTYNRYKYTAIDGAPAVEPRPEGCHVDVVEEGDKIGRPHADIGRIELRFPQAKLKEQGPEGAIKTLKAAACENGAYFVKDLRALPTGVGDPGLVYEGTLATLLGDDGQPMNAKRPDAGPIAGAAERMERSISEASNPPSSGGW